MRNEEGTGIQCPKCLDKLYSEHVDDFKYCSCEYCFVDGGKDHLRYGGGEIALIKLVDREGNTLPQEIGEDEE